MQETQSALIRMTKWLRMYEEYLNQQLHGNIQIFLILGKTVSTAHNC
jgi:hypothetical protein